MGIKPEDSYDLIQIIFNGRIFWIILLLIFQGCTLIDPMQVGLINLYFLYMICITSTLFVKNKKLKFPCALLILVNPILLLFLPFGLNDLIIVFFVIVSIYYFLEAFVIKENQIYVNFTYLIKATIIIIILTLIKPNIFIIIVFFLVGLYVYVKSKNFNNPSIKLYRKIFKILLIIVIIYELFIEIPYIILAWFLRSHLASFLNNFLFIAPIEEILYIFINPPWGETVDPFLVNFDKIYALIQPESLSILFISMLFNFSVLSFISLISRKRYPIINHNKQDFLILILFTSFVFLFIFTYTNLLGDIVRYSLSIIPLVIIIGINNLEKNLFEKNNLKNFFGIFTGMVLVLTLNIFIINYKGGINYIFGQNSQLITSSFLVIQLIFFSTILFLNVQEFKEYIKQNYKFRKLKFLNLKIISINSIFIFLIMNSFFFSTIFMKTSRYFNEIEIQEGLNKINSKIKQYSTPNNIIFLNNYVFLRPYLDDDIFDNNILSAPINEQEFYLYMQSAPDNSYIFISNDIRTTWYESSNSYLKNFINNDLIYSKEFLSYDYEIAKKLPLERTSIILNYTFNQQNNDTVILDFSEYNHDGISNNCSIVSGLYDNALRFNSSGYVSVNNSKNIIFRDEMCISFFAKFLESDNDTIISKGYAGYNGTFNIFIYNNRLSWVIGEVGSIYIEDIDDYLYDWHYYIFNYDGFNLQVIIDGVIKKTIRIKNNAEIRNSDFDIEIGRDSERKSYYFNGTIDELIISNKSLKIQDYLPQFLTSYAIKIDNVVYGENLCNIFELRNSLNKSKNLINVLNQIYYRENDNIFLNFEINTLNDSNIILLIGTSRFSKVIDYEIKKGNNNISFCINYSNDTFFWRYSYKVKMLILENRTIIFQDFMTIQINNLVEISLLVILLTLIIFWILINVNKKIFILKRYKNIDNILSNL